MGIRQALQAKEIPSHVKADLIEVEQKLAPNNLKAEIQAKVLAHLSYEYDLDDDDNDPPMTRHNRARAEAEKLGMTAAANKQLLSDLLPDILQNSNDKPVHFGIGVGKCYSDPRQLLEDACLILKESAPASVNLQFITGLISGWYTVKPDEVLAFLDEAIYHDYWADWFSWLQLAIDLDSAGQIRLMKALALGRVPSWLFRTLGYGRATDPLSVSEIGLILNALSIKDDDGLSVAIDILHMVVYGAKEKDENYKIELSSYCMEFLKVLNWQKFDHGNDNLLTHLNEVINCALQYLPPVADVSIVLSNFIHFERSEHRAYIFRKGRLLKYFFKYFPLGTLNAIYLIDEDGSYRTAINMLSDWSSNRMQTAAKKIPDETFIAWCEISPKDRYLFAAETCRLFDNSSRIDSSDDEHLKLSEAAKLIFSNARDKKSEVLKIFISRFTPTGWSGSLAEILKKRLKLLDDFEVGDVQQLQKAVSQAKDLLNKRILLEAEREDVDERSQTGSFE